MGNPSQGEVSFEMDGRTYIAKLDLRAHRSIEKELDIGSKAVIIGLDDGRVDYLFCVLWHALKDRNKDLRSDDIERWIDTKGLEPFMPLMRDLIKTSSVWRNLVKDDVGNSQPPPVVDKPEAAPIPQPLPKVQAAE